MVRIGYFSVIVNNQQNKSRKRNDLDIISKFDLLYYIRFCVFRVVEYIFFLSIYKRYVKFDYILGYEVSLIYFGEIE